MSPSAPHLRVARLARAQRALVFSAGLAATALAACKESKPAEVPDAVVAERARAALAPFKGELKDALTKAVSESPVHAISVCAERAPELATKASKDGVVVGRSSAKLRSPANAPRPWLVPVLDELARAPAGSDAHKVVSLPDGRRGYAEAIWVAPQCLVCHGESIAPEIAQAIDAKYPQDRARGFKPGDLRGVFWAELDASALSR